jgi:hypothetical protein
MKKIFISFVLIFIAAGLARADLLLSWTFSNSSGAITNQVANTIAGNLDTGGIFNEMTRGAGAAASAANNSFRTTGFSNDGISIANTDYFTFSISSGSGFFLSLTNIVANFAGTPSFSTNLPGVAHQWGYSIDGGAFSLIGSAVTRVGNGSSTFDFSGVSQLQNIDPASTVELRYYASGQTTTGGWGFFSTGGTAAAVSVNGTLTVVPEPSVFAMITIGGLAVARFSRRRHV